MAEIIVAVAEPSSRGSAIIRAYSPYIDGFLAFPGNGMMQMATDKPVEIFPEIKTTDKEAIVNICKTRGVSLLDVCQDSAVRVGVADLARANGILTPSPSRLAGKLEWSKSFTRTLVQDLINRGAKINQPEFTVWRDPQAATDWIKEQPEEWRFVKADGDALGKGAKSARTNLDAIRRINQMSDLKEAGETFLIEEWLRNDDGTPGREFSYFALCQYTKEKAVEIIPLGSADDYKTAFENNVGEMTGGMGGNNYSAVVIPQVEQEVVNDHIRPILEEMAERGTPYTGVIYYSGMEIKRGGKRLTELIEINSRFGDPEAQEVLPEFEVNWYELNRATAEGASIKPFIKGLKRDHLHRVGVVVASVGYPEDYSKVLGAKIEGIKEAMRIPGVHIDGGNVRYEKDTDSYYIDGSRLMTVVGTGSSVVEAASKAYSAVPLIYAEVDGLKAVRNRGDIASRAISKYYGQSKLVS